MIYLHVCLTNHHTTNQPVTKAIFQYFQYFTYSFFSTFLFSYFITFSNLKKPDMNYLIKKNMPFL